MQNSLENKNICFVANFYKTYFFHEIAKVLESEGINTYWIIPKLSQHTYLSKYFSNDRLLSIPWNIKTQNPINDYKINELIYGDRVLKYKSYEAISFLHSIQKPIYDFISNNKISYIFGECTWAHELLIHRIVSRQKELKCSYLSMHTIRIPNGRFAFFTDEKMSHILENQFSNAPDINIELKVEKPSYLKLNDAILKKNKSILGRVGRLKRFITGINIEEKDPNVNYGIRRIFSACKEEVNRETYKLIKKDDIKDIIKKKFILFGLHKQPEASVDVSGRYFENQYSNIVNLWRNLPNDWYLVVKEHSNAIGDRSYSFFKSILKFPNIIIAKESIDSYELMKHAQLVATNTGTMALESALMDIPAITFSPVFFNKLKYCRNINFLNLQNYNTLEELIAEITASGNNIDEYKEYIIRNSFEGCIGDIHATPSIIDSGNIHKVSKAILKLVKQ